MTANPEALMDFDQAVAWMRVDPAALRQLAEEGGIPARKVGGAWLFSPAAIHEWIRASYFDRPKTAPAFDRTTSTKNLVASAGVFKDDPLFDEWVENIRLNREVGAGNDPA